MVYAFNTLYGHLSRQRVSRKDSGATMAEYAFLLALIALVTYTAVQAFGSSVRSLFVVFPL